MGIYIGHCDACDVTLEVEHVLLHARQELIALKEKYGVEKATEMVNFLRLEVKTSSTEWFLDEPAKVSEQTEEVAVDKTVNSEVNVRPRRASRSNGE